MITKALIYCRVSSERQVKEGNGLQSQEHRCRELAKNKKYSVVGVFHDEGVSGGKFERPAIKALFEYLDDNPLDKIIVIIDDLSRLARDVQVYVQLKLGLEARGAKLECVNFNMDESIEGETAELMMAVINQYNRKSNRRQVMQKMKARLELGYWTFCTPPGMKNVEDPIRGKVLTAYEPYASIFKKAIEAFASDFINTREQVADFINSENQKEGISKKISCDGSHRILINPLYAGYLEYKPWGIPFMKGQHEGFITLETYQKAQNKLKDRSKPILVKSYSQDFPLRRFILCTTCNNAMTGSWNTGRHTKYPNYFCKTKGCPMRYKVIRREKIESEFVQLLSEVKPAPETVDLTSAVFNDVWKQKGADFQADDNRIVSRIKEIDLLVSGLSLRVAKTTDETLITSYETEIKKYQKEKEELQGKMIKNPYSRELFGTALNTVMGTIKDPMGMWQSDKLEQKQVILSMYFEEKIPYDYYKGFGTATLAYPIQLMNQKDGFNGHLVEMSAGDAESEDAT